MNLHKVTNIEVVAAAAARSAAWRQIKDIVGQFYEGLERFYVFAESDGVFITYAMVHSDKEALKRDGVKYDLTLPAWFNLITESRLRYLDSVNRFGAREPSTGELLNFYPMYKPPYHTKDHLDGLLGNYIYERRIRSQGSHIFDMSNNSYEWAEKLFVDTTDVTEAALNVLIREGALQARDTEPTAPAPELHEAEEGVVALPEVNILNGIANGRLRVQGFPPRI